MPNQQDGSIGALLRDARQSRGHSLEEVAWRLRMRPDVLRALEEESFDEVGHTGFVHTHLRSYARLLGLDAGDIVRRYRRMHEPAASSITMLDAAEKVSRKHLPRSRWMLAAAVAAICLVSASLVGVLRGPGAPAPSAARSSTSPAGPRLKFEPASRGLSPVQTDSVTVRIAAVRATGVTIVIDGKRSFAGTLAPGASQVFTGTKSIAVSVTEARAVQIWANDARIAPGVTGWWHGTFVHSGLLR